LLVLAKVVTILMPYSYKWATDALVSGIEGGSLPAAALWSAPVWLTLLYGVLRILMALLTQARDAVFAKVAMNAVRRLSMMAFSHMHRLSLAFHLERKTGGLTRILERGRDAVERLSRLLTLQLIPTILEFIMIFVVLWAEFRLMYAVIVVVMVAVYLAFTFQATRRRIAIRRKMNESDNEATIKAVDSLLNYETVKYFCAEELEIRRFDDAMAGYEVSSVETLTSLAVLNFGQALIFTVGMALLMVLCVRDVAAGSATVGGFVMINAMMIQLYIPLNLMGTIYRDIKQALTDIHDLFALLAQNPEISDVPGAVDLVVREGTIRFDNVCFSYQPEREILRGVSFEVPAGRTVALVGPSGAGKSTISRLLFRFYEPTSGAISIDGQDITMVTQSSLRRALGMVPQDTVLFNDTIGYNIRYGRADATDAEVREAARLAQIDRFIDALPLGYDTPVGERGLKLSGGEKQRIAIARAILKGPPLLVLDEATSALDSFTEKEIQNALDHVAAGRTTLVIAHRLSTVVHADEILVLDQGVIVERGSHAELLELNGLYAALWQRQREVDEAREKLSDLEKAAIHGRHAVNWVRGQLTQAE
ncbi:MAG: ABC transporter ATP-binding protein/permease, partial [Methylobacteriaceae bacterium]|nr:ABC transporter ATP-binding protein/permease [Methylobacteriaceae bacterium]